MILPKDRDPRFITVRRGGTLQDSDHRLLAEWAADCAEHVLDHFERFLPKTRYRSVTLRRTWSPGVVGETVKMIQSEEGLDVRDSHFQRVGAELEMVPARRLTGEPLVSEQYLLDLEREAFLSLCGQRKTQERMQGMLKTGKPVRN